MPTIVHTAPVLARSLRGQASVMRACGAILCAGTLLGCADWRFQTGLANARISDIDPIRYAETFDHPAITNGDASCPRSGNPEDDRLFHRWPACNASSPWARPLPPPRQTQRPPRSGPLAPLRDPSSAP